MQSSSLCNIISQDIRESSEVKLSLLNQVEQIATIAALVCKTVKDGGRVYCCGNGGSTCDSMHLTEELVARYFRERPGIAAHHLCDSSTMTCWANDYNFDSVFSRQVETLVTPKDILVAFSCSGNSKNILLALEAANKIGAKSVLLTGKGGGKAKELASLSLIVASNKTSRVQEAHTLLIHTLCEIIETTLYPDSK